MLYKQYWCIEMLRLMKHTSVEREEMKRNDLKVFQKHQWKSKNANVKMMSKQKMTLTTFSWMCWMHQKMLKRAVKAKVKAKMKLKPNPNLKFDDLHEHIRRQIVLVNGPLWLTHYLLTLKQSRAAGRKQ